MDSATWLKLFRQDTYPSSEDDYVFSLILEGNQTSLRRYFTFDPETPESVLPVIERRSAFEGFCQILLILRGTALTIRELMDYPEVQLRTLEVHYWALEVFEGVSDFMEKDLRDEINKILDPRRRLGRVDGMITRQDLERSFRHLPERAQRAFSRKLLGIDFSVTGIYPRNRPGV